MLCRNNETSQRNVLPASGQGKWELRESIGDMPLKKYEPGNGNVLQFSGSKYEIYFNQALVKKGTYIIEADATVTQSICLQDLENMYKHRIIFDNDRKYAETYSRELIA